MAAKFIQVSKAYKCFENQTTLDACLTFGNADGNAGGVNVGIALPAFLVQPENQVLVLAASFLALLLFVPATVFYLFRE